MFSDCRRKVEKDGEELQSELYRQIGQLKVEVAGSKKVPAASVEERRQMIKPGHGKIPISRQCSLLGLSSSSYYHRSGKDEGYNDGLMTQIASSLPKRHFMVLGR
jgi:hypothetical protein